MRGCSTSEAVEVARLRIISPIWLGTMTRVAAPSTSGFTCTTEPPRRITSTREVSRRGVFDAALEPISTIRSVRSRSERSTVPFLVPIEASSARPLASWHMLEQSGRLLVPNSLAKSENMKVASFESRPEV